MPHENQYPHQPEAEFNAADLEFLHSHNMSGETQQLQTSEVAALGAVAMPETVEAPAGGGADAVSEPSVESADEQSATFKRLGGLAGSINSGVVNRNRGGFERVNGYRQAAAANLATQRRDGRGSDLPGPYSSMFKASQLLGDARQGGLVSEVERATLLPDEPDLEDLSRTPDSRAADIVLRTERSVAAEQLFDKIASRPANPDAADPRDDTSRTVDERAGEILQAEQDRIDREEGGR